MKLVLNYNNYPYKVKVYRIKRCTKCNRRLIACKKNFIKGKRCKWGYRPDCKICNRKIKKRYYKDNKNEILVKNKYYRQENKEKIAEYQKQYAEKNKEKIQEYKKVYYEENKEKIQEYKKEYYEENPHIIFNACNRRRKKLDKQGLDITKEQWLEMMDFFNWRCAYSEEYLGGRENKKIRTIDHIISVDKGGLNVIWNIVPMHKSYNSSKWNKDMEDWYKKQTFYNEERLNKIYEWINYAYKKWI